MKRKSQILFVLCLSVAIASIVSHALVNWLRIETSTGGRWQVGSVEKGALAFVAGSSLAGDGIAWGRVSTEIGHNLEGWGVPGSSPWEWEQFQPRAKEAKSTFIIVSSYDLNEHFLCDFHSDVVSPFHSLGDLLKSNADWHYCKRVLSRYPLKYLRVLFPTAGRSQGVMSGLRDKLKRMVRPGSATSESKPTLAMGQSSAAEEGKSETISTWSEARTLRRMALMRGACQGKHSYKGPKNLAFQRMLQYAQSRGQVTVAVLPISPTYAKEFLTMDVIQEFEKALTEAKRVVPQARWVRLDELPELKSNECFWDFVHMNRAGQQIATDALLKNLSLPMAASASSPSNSSRP